MDATQLAEKTAAHAFEDAKLNPDGSMSAREFRSWYSRSNKDSNDIFRNIIYFWQSSYFAGPESDGKLGPTILFDKLHVHCVFPEIHAFAEYTCVACASCGQLC